MKLYDTVIVGAGPAGLNCAEKLKGKKVLVLERNARVGPKVCAGGLTGDDIDYLRLPERLVSFRFRKIVIRTPGEEHRIALQKRFNVYTVDREELGQWQLERTRKAGAEIRTGAEVTKVGKDFVEIGGKERIGFCNIVGADGSSSLVRRHLSLPVEKMGVAMHYVVPQKGYRDLTIFFDAKVFGPWYAWIFPHKRYVSIGCGGDPGIIPAGKLRKAFDGWLMKNGIDCSGGTFQAHPINFDYRGHSFGNAFLAGDAAGLASGLTGEGIFGALVSGERVAGEILGKGTGSGHFEQFLTEKKEEDDMLSRLCEMARKHAAAKDIEDELLSVFAHQAENAAGS